MARWEREEIGLGVHRVPYDPDLPLAEGDPCKQMGYVQPSGLDAFMDRVRRRHNGERELHDRLRDRLRSSS